jgi:hypothetical protein
MSFDFAVNGDGASTTNNDDDTEKSPDFDSNEVGDLYLTSGDWKRTLKVILDALDLEEIKIYHDDTLEDLGRLLEENSDAHPQQKLHLVANLFKSTAGKMQRDNDHSIGLQQGKAPESHEEANGDFSYALHSVELPTINWAGLTDEEADNLEEMGIEADDLGFDTTYGGPKLLAVAGKRLPIAVEDGGEIEEAIEILQALPNEPSRYTEDDFQESSDPSVFGEVTTDGGESAEGNDDGVYNLAAFPEKVVDVTVSDLRGDGPSEHNLMNITSARTLRTMLAKEQSQDNPRKSAVKRLEERINAVSGGEDDGEADDQEVEEAVEAVEDESDRESSSDGMTLEEARQMYAFSDMEANAVEFRFKKGKADSIEEAAQQVADL